MFEKMHTSVKCRQTPFTLHILKKKYQHSIQHYKII